MIKILYIFILLLITSNSMAETIDKVLVIKSKSRLYLLKENKVIKEYKVVFGFNRFGPKHQKGDERTPEGTYYLDYKNPNSMFHKSIHISYPSEKDIEWAKQAGVNPGGSIYIHGLRPNDKWLESGGKFVNWTDGCIAVISNKDMDEIWNYIEEGNIIEITP